MAKLITTHHSVRSFLDKPVSINEIGDILDVARFAQSGGNMQPWRVHILGKQTREKLYRAIEDQVSKSGFVGNGDYQYYPKPMMPPFDAHVKQSGQDIYDALDIRRRNTQKARAQKMKNFAFYGAPVGLIITIDAELAQGSWIDVGLFLNALSLSIADHGLGCCLQASFSSYGNCVRDVLALPANKRVVCGVAIGHENPQDPINSLPKRRLTVDEIGTFYP